MIIKRIDVFHTNIPCKQPFETSFGVINHRPALIIQMMGDNGLYGYGESSTNDIPMSEPETTAEAMVLLKQKLPKLIGFPVDEGMDIVGLFYDATHPVSLFGIEAAYMDLLAKKNGVSLGALFGATHSNVIAGESVGLQPSIDLTLQKVDSYIKTGHSRIKVKIAKGRDVEIIKAVREKYPLLNLAADANATYTNKDTAHLAGLTKYNLSFIEQPFMANDFKSHTILQTSGIPVCLDETILDLKTCQRAINEKSCEFINIKPARIGSFKESRKIHDLCVREGVKLFGGGRLETGIGKTANAAFYGLPGFTDPSDITPPKEYLEADIITPEFNMNQAVYTIPDLPGIGVNININVLKKFTINHYIFQ